MVRLDGTEPDMEHSVGYLDRSKKDPGPNNVKNWRASEVEDFFVSLGVVEGAKIVSQYLKSNGGDGATAAAISKAEIKSLGLGISEQAKVSSAIDALNDPLLPTFMECDGDGNFKIDAEELARTLTRASGKPVLCSAARHMIEEADMDGDDEINFNDFKRIMGARTKSLEWIRAQEDLGVGQRLLAAADLFLAPTHATLRTGTVVSTNGPSGAPPRRVPSVGVRLAAHLIGEFISAVLMILSAGMFPLWCFFYLNARGQTGSFFFFGLKYVDHDTGKTPTRMQLALGLWGIQFFIGYIAVMMIPSVYGGITPLGTQLMSTVDSKNKTDAFQLAFTTYTVNLILGTQIANGLELLNICAGLFDKEGRTPIEWMLGMTVIYKEDDKINCD